MIQGQIRSASLPSGKAALIIDDQGNRLCPASEAEWGDWVSASRTRNYALDDPLLDWLGAFGAARGFAADTMRSGYDPRTDFSEFILNKGMEFEAAVMRLIKKQIGLVRIGRRAEDTRLAAMAEKTVDAMRAGSEFIAQGVLRNPNTRTYGAVDALIRSDVLCKMFPQDISAAAAAVPAPLLGGAPYHYVVLDIKFHTLGLLADGASSQDVLPFMVQVWIYNEALGRIQGYVPPAMYLLGRNWRQGADGRGGGPFERVARVDRDRMTTHGPLSEVALGAAAWIRRMRHNGAGWQVLPKPTVEELYPNMKSIEDAPWHEAKREIARALKELTILSGVSVSVRKRAHSAGLYRWSDPRAANILRPLVGAQYRDKLEGELKINH